MNSKADKSYYPFRLCLLRIPNSLNGKCLERRGDSLENSIVKIIQEWTGYRPLVVDLLYDFRNYLIQKKIDEYNYKQKLPVANKKKRNKNHRDYYPNKSHNNNYDWIEIIIEIPFQNYRKIMSSLILAPYLINVKKLPFQQCYKIIREWLDKCNSLQKLDDSSSFISRISYSLKNAKDRQIGPISLYKKDQNRF